MQTKKNAGSEYRDMARTILSGKTDIQVDPQKANAVNAQSVKPRTCRRNICRSESASGGGTGIPDSPDPHRCYGWAEKELAQRELDNRREISLLRRQKEDYIQAVIRFEKEKFEAEEELKAKQAQALCEKIL